MPKKPFTLTLTDVPLERWSPTLKRYLPHRPGLSAFNMVLGYTRKNYHVDCEVREHTFSATVREPVIEPNRSEI